MVVSFMLVVFIAEICGTKLYKQTNKQTNKLADIGDNLNPLTPELNPSMQHCLTRFFIGDFAS
jgi:hypothetical protein